MRFLQKVNLQYSILKTVSPKSGRSRLREVSKSLVF